jgi:hypothetical protein
MIELPDALENCLTQLSTGETTFEDCIAKYPEYAGELSRLILTAAQVEQQSRGIKPAPEFKSRMRAQLRAHMHEQPHSPPTKLRLELSNLRFKFALGWVFNTMAGLAALVLLFVLTGTVLAQTALPGDSLYSWRIISENVWRTVYPDRLTVDLALTTRRARDLSRVVGNPPAELVARREYQQSLNKLSSYADPSFRDALSEALNTQKVTLSSAQVIMPELDALLQKVTGQQTGLAVAYAATKVEANGITYTLLLTNRGSAGPVTATLLSSYLPVNAVTSISGAGCDNVNQVAGSVTCTPKNLAMGTPQLLTITVGLNPCYSGVLTNTIIISAANNLANPITMENNIPLAFPSPAKIAYVQSNGSAHRLGWATASGQVLNYNLHFRAAAPAWSPDGAKLAFFGEQGISELGTVYGQGNGLWIIDVGTGQEQNPRQLVAQDHIKNIAWSPDGTKLAFEVKPPDQTAQVVIVVDASGGRQISSFPGGQPAWSANSQKLAIKNCAPACGLWQVNFDGSDPQQLTFEATDSYPAWSPTGEYLAFTSNRDDNWEVYRLNLTNGQLLRMTHRPATDTTPVFGPCGQDVYLRTDQFGSWWLTVMKLNGDDERKVVEGVGPSDDWGLARSAIH